MKSKLIIINMYEKYKRMNKHSSFKYIFQETINAELKNERCL